MTNLYKLKIGAEKVEALEATLDALDSATEAIQVITPAMGSIDTIATILDEIQDLADIKTELESIYADKTKLDSLYTDKVILDTLYSIKAKLDSLYADKTKIDSIYADKTQLDEIYNNLTEILDAVNQAQIATEQANRAEGYADSITLVNIDTISALRALSTAPITVWVSGYYTKGDGAFGSHIFRWNSTSVEADNGGTIIKLDSIETGRYELRYDGAVNVKWFGARGIGTSNDDTSPIQKALSYSATLYEGASIYIPSGYFKITSTLDWNDGMKIVGESNRKTIIFLDAPFIDMTLTNTEQFKDIFIEDIQFRPLNTMDYMMDLTSMRYSKFENVLFEGKSLAQTAIRFSDGAQYALYNDFNKCKFVGFTVVAFNMSVKCTYFTFRACNFKENAKNFIAMGKGHFFHQCSLEHTAGTTSEVSLIYSPNTMFSQCWLEYDILSFKSGAYGCSVIDCRSTNGGNSDKFLEGVIKDETLEQYIESSTHSGLYFREGNKELKIVYSDRDLHVKNGFGFDAGRIDINGVSSHIVGYGFKVIGGGNTEGANLQIGKTNASINSDTITRDYAYKTFTLANNYSTGDLEIVTWSSDSSIYTTINGEYNKIYIGTSGTDTSTNLNILPFAIVVG